MTRRSRAETREAEALLASHAAFEKPAALRSAPSKDRQIAGVYTAIPEEGKGGAASVPAVTVRKNADVLGRTILSIFR